MSTINDINRFKSETEIQRNKEIASLMTTIMCARMMCEEAKQNEDWETYDLFFDSSDRAMLDLGLEYGIILPNFEAAMERSAKKAEKR